MSDHNLIKRRMLIKTLGAACSTSLLSMPSYAKNAPIQNDGKFSDTGNVLPWAGDTIICPLPFNSPAFQEMLNINAEVTRHFRDYVAATPPASYHMTIYGCADPQRRAAHLWPAGKPLTAPIAEITQTLLERLQAQRFTYPSPIRMRVDTDETKGLTIIPLLPADTSERTTLYQLRHDIARTTGLMTPNLDTFRFHITFGYPFRPMPDDVAAAFQKACMEWRNRLAARSPYIDLPAPLYCRFTDMFAFEPLMTLKRKI
ncbi:DUF1868 domain-containing protein [Neokomagataea anthophila]|uniref:DUF1868 domain-containing protein n=1 Tax=Neokomagataea anthophila TaxID=2826925 RepID=A0ABS5E9H7_9PROT|nr:DUF1868 domain-containing protein [Neokomagataea anthophila]MBR0560564.1 DUF1868 domain-containing protein [Neokomagataea anthophila]